MLEAPREMPPLPSGLAKGRLPSLDSLGLKQEVEEPAVGGESEAHKALDRFLDGPVREYTEIHDALGKDRTSRLSPYLHFGCITPRQIEERLPRGKGPEAFRRQLCWRDFYHHVLAFHPKNAKSEFQERYRGKIKWSYAEKRFERWCEGQTGFPLVDAGMRQLKREGWMHNRARLVVGSFLTKDLGIDWRWGERHFMRYLIDGDEANNNGNWQWIASVGVDPQPPYRRIYNPALHMERYDPDGDYVRRYVPELEHVPDKYLREPWTMPAEVQKDCGVVIGEDYPEPMVDRKIAREEALERYRSDCRCRAVEALRAFAQGIHSVRERLGGRFARDSDARDGRVGHRGDDPRVARRRGRRGLRGRHDRRGLDRQDRRRGARSR